MAIENLVGNAQAIERMQTWLDSWKTNRRRSAPMLLAHGPPGCGKTTAAHMLLSSRGYAVTEINASSVTYEELKARFGMTVMANRGLLGKRDRSGRRPPVAVLLDEVDGLCRRESDDDESGGAFSWLWKIVENPRRIAPIVCTCNDRYARRMRAIAQRTAIVSFRALDSKDLLTIARRSLTALDASMPTKRLLHLVNRARGDARALINDLEFETRILTPASSYQTGRDHAPSDFEACERTLRNQPSDVRFSSSSNAVRFLWKNACAALEATSCAEKQQPAVDRRRCDALAQIFDDFSSMDGCKFDAIDGWRLEIARRTVRAAYQQHRLMAPSKQRLGRLKFPYANELATFAERKHRGAPEGAQSALDCYFHTV